MPSGIDLAPLPGLRLHSGTASRHRAPGRGRGPGSKSDHVAGPDRGGGRLELQRHDRIRRDRDGQRPGGLPARAVIVARPGRPAVRRPVGRHGDDRWRVGAPDDLVVAAVVVGGVGRGVERERLSGVQAGRRSAIERELRGRLRENGHPRKRRLPGAPPAAGSPGRSP